MKVSSPMGFGVSKVIRGNMGDFPKQGGCWPESGVRGRVGVGGIGGKCFNGLTCVSFTGSKCEVWPSV